MTLTPRSNSPTRPAAGPSGDPDESTRAIATACPAVDPTTGSAPATSTPDEDTQDEKPPDEAPPAPARQLPDAGAHAADGASGATGTGWRGLRAARAAVALAALLAGLAAVVVAGLVAVAPVESSTSTVSWPRAGGEAAPTTLFLVPYRPAALTVTVPCSAIRAALDRGGRTTLIATSTSGGADGLVVRADEGELQVLTNGRSVRPDVPEGDCGLTVTANGSGLAVAAGPSVPQVFPGDPVPEVFAVTTDLTGPDAAELSLRARTPAWFDNAPTPEKSALVTLQLQLAAVALGLLVVLGVLVPAGKGGARPRVRALVAHPRDRLRRAREAATVRAARSADRMAGLLRRPAEVLRRIAVLAIDAVVAAVLGWWSLVGPVTDDDGFATVIARESLGGDVGNYYRWYDASEAPFASSQRVLQWFLDDGLTPVALRTPSILAGFALWLVVTRGVLRPVLGPLADRAGVRLLAALGLAVWWLPYDLGTRPESLVALGTTTVLALVLRAVRRRTGPSARPAVLLALAAGIAALTTTVAPSGLVGVAPFLLCAPRVWQVLHHGGAGVEDRASRAEAVLFLLARFAVPLGLAAVAVTVVFAQQSWHGVLVSTVVHDQIGPSQPWYAEWLRYTYLFGQDNWGTATKRLPVLLGLVLALPALVLLARRGVRDAGPSVLLALLPAGFVLLAVTPSKWSHHFGALAGFGAVAMVVVVVGLVAEARRTDARLGVIGAVTTVGLLLAAPAAFNGPGSWWGYSNIGMPAATGPHRPFDDPLLWAGVAAVVAVLLLPLVRRARRLPALPALTAAVLAVLVAATSVGILITSAATAADRGDRFSLAAQNRAAVADPTSRAACGMQERVEVLQPVEGGPLQPERGSTAVLEGFVADGGAADPPPRRPEREPSNGPDTDTDTDDGRAPPHWGSKDDDAGLGELTTPWFALPGLGEAQELAIGVAGRTDDGASVSWEFARGTQVLGAQSVRELPEPERGYRGYAGDAEQQRLQDQTPDVDRWRTITLTPGDLPADADRVRLRATDDRADETGWVAVSGPRVVDVLPLDRWLTGRGPVLTDWAIASAWPCLGDLPRVAGGIAQAPGAVVTTPAGPPDPGSGERLLDVGTPSDIVPERWVGGSLGLATGTDVGGSFAGMYQAGSVDELDTRLRGEPERRWGRVLVPNYGDLDTDAYDVTTQTTTIAGTAGDPPPIRSPRPITPPAS